MDYKDLRAEILPRWEEVLQRITTPAKKKGEYVCVLCGHGAHGDGLKANPRSTKYGLKCFGGCGFSGDILEYLKQAEHLDSFPEQLERASSLLGLNIEDYRPTKEEGQSKTKTERKGATHTDMSTHTDTHTHTDMSTEPEAEKDYISYYRECNKRLSETDYLSSRGISEATANKYLIGYDPEAKPYGESKATRWKGLIIPTGKSSYIIRNTDTTAQAKQRYGKVGSINLFNIKAIKGATSPIVIVEGELDALSIIEVGGEAVGLGSTANTNKLIEELKTRKPAQPIIIALDNDEAGRKASEELSKSLSELKLPSYMFDLYGQAKDANEALLSDRESLAYKVANLAERIRKEEERKLEAERKDYLRTETAYGFLNEFINGIKASVNTPATPTGFQLLDRDILDGGLYEGLYCIGAITSLGKTTLALQIADQIAKNTEKRVLIFSLEMSRAELISKSLSRLTLSEVLKQGKDTRLAKTARGITDGERHYKYSEEENKIIYEALSSYGKDYAKKITIYEGIGDIGVEKIREEVARVARLFGEAPIVIVDYLQILAPYNEEYIRASDKQNTDKNVVELKRISRDYKTTIIGISSFNRDNYTAPVNLTSFKESGAIEYSSDVLIGLQFAGMDYEEGEAEKARDKRIRELRKDQEAKGRAGQAQTIQLKVLKNRYGCKGDVILSFYPMFNYFEENIEANT
jgi:replicative DNA helicase